MSDDSVSRRPARSGRSAAEASLTETLVEMFSARDLYTFIRHRISDTLANSLPSPDHTSRSDYAALVAEKAADHELVPRLREELQAERERRAGGVPAGASRSAGNEPQYETEESRALSARLQKAMERRERLEEAGADTADVVEEILQLKRTLRRGGQVQAGDMLGKDRYLLIEQLGRGGFATVWRAQDRHTGDEVAIKVLHGNLVKEPVRRDRFFRGARIMAELDHPAVIQVLEAHGEDDGYHYFVMELASGGSLHKAVLAGEVPPDRAIPLILDLGRALEAAHERGFVHRDVKPANVLLTSAGEARLTDFDLVAAADTTGGTRTGAMGTFVYAAPEQLDRPQDVDVRADIYGLAMTAAFIVHGNRLPITVMRDAPGFVEHLEIKSAVREVLANAVSWEPDNRFASMDEFCDALARAEESVDMAMVWLPTGQFTMEGREDDDSAYDDENPVHEVELSGFWMGKTVVTNAQYEHYVRKTGKEPGLWSNARFNAAEQPVVGVSWYDAVTYCNFLSDRAGLTRCYEIVGEEVRWTRSAEGYRLPTEAEWEYACRAGEQTRWWFGDAESDLGEYRWYGPISTKELLAVARKSPNPRGLHDMHGNVWEWCWDWYGPYCAKGKSRNPTGPTEPSVVNVWDEEKQEVATGTARLLRGGSAWSADRLGGRPVLRVRDVSFRCVRGAIRQP